MYTFFYNLHYQPYKKKNKINKIDYKKKCYKYPGDKTGLHQNLKDISTTENTNI